MIQSWRIYTGDRYRGTVAAAGRAEAVAAGRLQFGLPAGWTVDAFAPGASLDDDPSLIPGADELGPGRYHRAARARPGWSVGR